MKDESELTMCTDVDRNDKSRVCEAGSVRVIGRRQIELYSRLIHTVDHVEGVLREEFDALDGFLSHAWAVTVTGAPKRWAIRFIENEERSSRRWYGGAIGRVTFDGNMNTGLTLRTIRMKDGVAEVRAGATLLYDSDPRAEEAECRLKAAAMFTAIRGAGSTLRQAARGQPRCGRGRQEGAADRSRGFFRSHAGQLHPHDRRRGRDDAPGSGARRIARRARSDLVVLSPGPGRPSDFEMAETLDLLVAAQAAGVRRVPRAAGDCRIFRRLARRARHSGARQAVAGPRAAAAGCCAACREEFTVGRYHSLHAVRSTLPPELAVTAETEDGVVMAVEHQRLPIAAVQFHPELVMTLHAEIGLPIIAAVLSALEPEFS